MQENFASWFVSCFFKASSVYSLHLQVFVISQQMDSLFYFFVWWIMVVEAFISYIKCTTLVYAEPMLIGCRVQHFSRKSLLPSEQVYITERTFWWSDGSLLVELLWRLDLWASMRSFNSDFPPWRCSRRQRRRGKRRHHPLGNKPWKKELHHQDEPWIRSLERMLQWRKRKRERKREGEARNWRNKRGREVELWSMSHKTLIHQSYNKCYTCFYL